VEHQAAYRTTLEGAGTAHLLLQVFVDDGEHNKLSAAIYPAALAALADWTETRRRPTPGEVRGRCEALRARHAGECRILSGYTAPAWGTRVNPR
jgi:hypothetical protein